MLHETTQFQSRASRGELIEIRDILSIRLISIAARIENENARNGSQTPLRNSRSVLLNGDDETIDPNHLKSSTNTTHVP